jgi:hypothetical protein
MSSEEWVANFQRTLAAQAQEKTKAEVEYNQKFRKLLFPEVSPEQQPQSSQGRKGGHLTEQRRKSVFAQSTKKPTGSKPKTNQSLKSSMKVVKPRIPGQRSETALAVLRKVRDIHDAGTIQITPCSRCFERCRQCVKSSASRACAACLKERKRCEGAYELGKWVEHGDQRVILRNVKRLTQGLGEQWR